MRQTSTELGLRVRQNLFEYQKPVLTDDHILSKLNEAYREVYQILIKSYPDVIAKTTRDKLTKGVLLLPRDLKSARILEVYAESYSYGKMKLEQVSYTEYIRLPTNQTSAPMAYCINNDRLMVYPQGQEADVIVVYVPELIPLGKIVGQIEQVNAGSLPLYNVQEAIDELDTEKRIVTICDVENGRMKASFKVRLADATLFLQEVTNTRYRGVDVTPVVTGDGEQVSVLPNGRIQVMGSTTFTEGDSVTLEDYLTLGEDYYTEYATNRNSSTPDYTHISFGSIKCTVVNADKRGIILEPEQPFVPLNTILKDGFITTSKDYVTDPNPVPFTVVDVGYGYSQVVCDRHGIGEPGEEIFVTLLGTDLNLRAKILTVNTIELPYEVTTETSLQAIKVETVEDRLYSIPRMYTSGTERIAVPPMLVIKNPAMEEEETVYTIYENDLVSLGATTGTHNLDTNFEKYLIYYATTLIKDSMQEDVGILVRLLDSILKDIHADIGYRRLNRKMKSETPRLNHFATSRGLR